jgi:hypothetical protein
MIDLNCPHCKAPLTEEQIRRLVGSLNGRLGGRKPKLEPGACDPRVPSLYQKTMKLVNESNALCAKAQSRI